MKTNIKETKDYRKECWYDDVNYHGPDQLGETISRWSRYTLDALLNYDKTFNQDHHFKAMVGYKIEKYDYRNLYAFRKSFPNSRHKRTVVIPVNWLCYLISDVSIMTIKASIFWKPISAPMLLLALQKAIVGDIFLLSLLDGAFPKKILWKTRMAGCSH